MVLHVFFLLCLFCCFVCGQRFQIPHRGPEREPMFSAMAAPPILHKYLSFGKISKIRKTLRASHSQPSPTFEIEQVEEYVACTYERRRVGVFAFTIWTLFGRRPAALWRAIWGPRQSLCVISTPNGWRQPAALHMILAEDVKSFIILFIKLYSHKTEKLQRYASIKI